MSDKTIHHKDIGDIIVRYFEESADGHGTEEKMDIIANALHDSLDGYFWVGFFIPDGDEMTLGPSAGPPACATIGYGGVCGKAAETGETVIVPDVDKFPGHIACDPRSKSEIVVPVFDADRKLIAVLDADSDRLNTFDESDKELLEGILKRVFG